MKYYNYARKRRQLKFLTKRLRKLFVANGAVLSQQTNRLLVKIKKIRQSKKPILSSIDFRKALGPAVVLFGLGLSTPATAQNFALPQSTPFGLDTIRDFALPSFVDVDADGDLDLFVAQDGEPYEYSSYRSNFLFFENTGTLGTPALGTPLVNPFGTMSPYNRSSSHLSFADLDGDGDQDFITGGNYGEFYYHKNIGTPSAPEFDAPLLNPFGLDSLFYVSTPELVDLDGDGDFDLISGEIFYNDITTMQYGNFVFFQNTGTTATPSFAPPVKNPFGLSSTENFNMPSVADVDDDGDLDIFAAEALGNLLYFENIGSSTAPQFADPLSTPFGITINPLALVSIPELSDLDNDGDMDLFIFDHLGVGLFYENTVKNPVNVKEVTPAFDLIVFPNPVQDEVLIQTSKEIQQVEVFDLLGRSLQVFHSVGKTISLANLPTGMYTLRLTDKNGDFVLKKIQKS